MRGRTPWSASGRRLPSASVLLMRPCAQEASCIPLPQSNIESTGYRSLQQGEEVEFDLVIGEDGKRKAFRVTGPQGAPLQVGSGSSGACSAGSSGPAGSAGQAARGRPVRLGPALRSQQHGL